MPQRDDAAIEVTAFEWVPDFARGHVREKCDSRTTSECVTSARTCWRGRGTRGFPRRRGA